MRHALTGTAAALALALAGCGGATETRSPEQLGAAQDKSQKSAEDDEREMHKQSVKKPK